jgi:hypothetical protein
LTSIVAFFLDVACPFCFLCGEFPLFVDTLVALEAPPSR